MKKYNIIYCVLIFIAVFNMAIKDKTFDNTYMAMCCMASIAAIEAKRRNIL